MKQRAEGAPDVAGVDREPEAPSGAAGRITRVFDEAIREAIPAEGEQEPEGDEG